MTQVRISDALRAVVFEPTRDLTEALDEFYAPDYTHRSDGETLDRAGFVEMVARVRGQVVGGSVRVIDELRDGLRYAEWHVYEITLADGSTAKREIAIFGSYAEDGRFRHLSETGFDLSA
ncbi:hypothetical protein [Micromonospora ureilytica]|uniref:hypothetical protein n=1 Tax=Micromonospora ureilytica TaxID=709868 RepID=UPI002E1257FE|nr:hypothetical protein OHB55_12945 [Micromonospora ureilytica]